MADNRMCPHCRAFVDSKEKICPYCGGEVARRLTQPVNSSAAGPMSSQVAKARSWFENGSPL